MLNRFWSGSGTSFPAPLIFFLFLAHVSLLGWLQKVTRLLSRPYCDQMLPRGDKRPDQPLRIVIQLVKTPPNCPGIVPLLLPPLANSRIQ